MAPSPLATHKQNCVYKFSRDKEQQLGKAFELVFFLTFRNLVKLLVSGRFVLNNSKVSLFSNELKYSTEAFIIS